MRDWKLEHIPMKPITELQTPSKVIFTHIICFNFISLAKFPFGSNETELTTNKGGTSIEWPTWIHLYTHTRIREHSLKLTSLFTLHVCALTKNQRKFILKSTRVSNEPSNISIGAEKSFSNFCVYFLNDRNIFCPYILIIEDWNTLLLGEAVASRGLAC